MDFGMIEDLLKDDQSVPTDIKVIGVGGAGGNAVNRMIASGLKKVTFVSLNTDVQALQKSNAQIRMPIGKQLTGGLGAGGVPDVGEQAAIESKEEIKEMLAGTDMVFITAGMGGGTGTGAAPVVAEIARNCGILTIAVVTTPFAFEGKKKFQLAQSGIEKLRGNVDTLILIPNQYLITITQNNTPIKQAFLMADDVLRQGVQGISELITEPGVINIDFADVRTVMKGKGDALMGIGIGEGENRAVDAARQAIKNPLIENSSILGATSVLVNICGGESLTLNEYQQVVECVTESCDPMALIIAGQSFNAEMGDKLKVTVVATGFESRNEETMKTLESNLERKQPQQTPQQPVYEEPAPRYDRPQYAPQSAPQQAPQQPGGGYINVDRWQDLKSQLGNRGSEYSDYSMPAVLRYSQDDQDRRK